MERLRAIWERIRADIKRAPLWVWIGLALTLVLVYFAWRNSSSGSSSSGDPLPIPQDIPPIGGGGGGGGGSPPPGGGGGNGPPVILPPPDPTQQGNPFTDWIQRHSSAAGQRVATDIRSNYGPLVTPNPGETGIPIGAGYGTLINNPLAASQRAHRGIGIPIGAGYGTPINNPLAASQRAHRGLPVQTDTATLPHPTLRIWTGSGAQRARNVD